MYGMATRKQSRAKPGKGKGKPEPAEDVGAESVPMSRQEKFCRLVAISHQTPFEAYLEAFEWKGTPRAAHQAADGLMMVDEIQQRIEELQPFLIEPPLGEDMLTLGEHLRELAQLERIAVRMGQIGAAVNAAVHRGKASGLYVERSISAHVTLEQLISASRKDGQISVVEGSTVRRIDDGSGAKYAKGQPVKAGPALRRGRTL